MKCLLIFLSIAFCFGDANAQSLLDPSFGNNGYAYTSINGNNKGSGGYIDTALGNRIVSLGTTENPNQPGFYLKVVAKYNGNGIADSNFTPYIFPDSMPFIKQYGNFQFVKEQPDKKVLIGGDYQIPGTMSKFFILRILSDGSGLDSSFGINGIKTCDLYGGRNHFGGAVLQPDGKIVLMGKVDSAYITGFGCIRMKPDGSIDSTFGANGKVITNVGFYYNTARALSLQPDGKIVAAGHGDNTPSSNLDFVVVRYLPNGQLDTSFNHTGIKYASNNNPGFELLKDMKLQADGKILLVGGGSINTDSFIVVRLNADGRALDTSFNHTGVKAIPTDDANEVIGIRRFSLQPDGKILILGGYEDNNKNTWDIYRLLPDGSIDQSFGNANGRIKMLLHPAATEDGVGDILVRNDGRILAAGFYKNASGDNVRTIVRFYKDGVNSAPVIKKEEATVRIYPNPANGKLYIKSLNRQIIQIQVVDVTGRTVFYSGTQQTELPTKLLPDGLYILKLFFKDHTTHTEKLSIQHR